MANRHPPADTRLQASAQTPATMFTSTPPQTVAAPAAIGKFLMAFTTSLEISSSETVFANL